MSTLGTFWEGIVLIAAAIAAAVLGKLVGIDWLMTIVAPALFAAGIAYSTGGAAGKVQLQRMMARKSTR